MPDALGLLEVESWTAAIASLDAAAKAGDVRLLQVELNDAYGALIKLTGGTADVEAALAAGRAMAERMRVKCLTDLIPAPDPAARPAYEAKPEFNPLIEQDVVHVPRPETGSEETPLS